MDATRARNVNNHGLINDHQIPDSSATVGFGGQNSYQVDHMGRIVKYVDMSANAQNVTK
jgi:hypothetical protein